MDFNVRIIQKRFYIHVFICVSNLTNQCLKIIWFKLHDDVTYMDQYVIDTKCPNVSFLACFITQLVQDTQNSHN